MRFVVLLLCLSASVATAFAQRHRITINAETPEGAILQQIGQESDVAKKLSMLEDFAAKNPKHDAIAWVYFQLHENYLKASQWDKAIDAGAKLLAVDPVDHEVAFGNLKAAEAKKDNELIRKWAIESAGVSRKVLASTKPASDDDAEHWKHSLERAKGMNQYAEYALSTAAIAAFSQPQQLIPLVETLETLNPKSEYISQVYAPYVYALQQSGQKDKAVATAERAIENGVGNEDLLVLVAGSYIERKSPDKVIQYASKAVETVNARQKPANLSDADWEKRKAALLGGAQFMLGVTYSGQSDFAKADQNLRAALPLVSADQRTQAEALFHLGLVNYKLAQAQKNKPKMQDALKFTQQCAAIKSPFQPQAIKNLAVIKQDPLSR